MFCFFLIGNFFGKVYAVHSFVWLVCLFIHSFLCFHVTGSPLQLSFVGCDGGKNDDSSIPGNVLFYGSGSGQNNSEWWGRGRGYTGTVCRTSYFHPWFQTGFFWSSDKLTEEETAIHPVCEHFLFTARPTLTWETDLCGSSKVVQFWGVFFHEPVVVKDQAGC